MSLRADARRNRDAIIAAAMEVFAEDGLDAHTQAIAERAGVGIGTLFRHFPTKDALVEAVGMAQTRNVIDRFHQVLREPDPAGAFERLMWHFTGQHAQYRAVPRVLSNTTSAEIGRLKAELYDVLAQAVTLAQQAGRLRADLALTDVLLLMDACAHVADGTSGLDPALRRRFMAVVFDGMRAANGTTLPRISRAAPVDSWLAVYQTRPASGPSTAH